MDITHIVDIPKISINTKTFLQRLQMNWLADQFKLYEDADYSVDTEGNYVIRLRSFMQFSECFIEDIYIMCNEEQTKILKAFELILNL